MKPHIPRTQWSAYAFVCLFVCCLCLSAGEDSGRGVWNTFRDMESGADDTGGMVHPPPSHSLPHSLTHSLTDIPLPLSLCPTSDVSGKVPLSPSKYGDNPGHSI